ncbi:hypothetical protein [Bradyrhizobium archetypum]|uniref:Uncharacterized protein n=1 Tax=Bradyrhizobium archetypum TaxID=2721160 RepID=A0A7Y4H8M8_9BRAD|nr:hypothetical protein [Bradyrhizobium archetypum]NOJ48762.1 hypothetical protein [Bradyrhizobium archetypum]
MSDRIGIATPAKKKSARSLILTSDLHASADMLDDLRIIRLDYPLDIVNTPLLASWIRDLIKSDCLSEEAMCGFTVDLIDFDQLSDAQKKTLLRKLQRKQKNLRSQLEDVNESLKGITRAIREVERKSKPRR